jgi:hypothetical protein
MLNHAHWQQVYFLEKSLSVQRLINKNKELQAAQPAARVSNKNSRSTKLWAWSEPIYI